jgi:hypothetical protein
MSYNDFMFFYVRLLEEGKIQEAESAKHKLEQSQREKRKGREEQKVTYSARWFM